MTEHSDEGTRFIAIDHEVPPRPRQSLPSPDRSHRSGAPVPAGSDNRPRWGAIWLSWGSDSGRTVRASPRSNHSGSRRLGSTRTLLHRYPALLGRQPSLHWVGGEARRTLAQHI